MITYRIAEAELRKHIEAHRSGWLRRARRRTSRFVTAGSCAERASIWAEIKPVFMALQHDKCAFCERQLASTEYGGPVEHDLEHFRPKRDVRAWPGDATMGGDMPSGYYWLAYDPLNYATSCKQCNSSLKRNYFPIAGQRGTPPARPPELLASERPWLIFPVGDWDEQAESLVTFEGIVAKPAAPPQDQQRHRRGQLTIDFFRLNRRHELRRERARCLVDLALALEQLNGADAGARPQVQGLARASIRDKLAPSHPHCNCCRAFAALYQTNSARALELASRAADVLKSLG